MAAVSRENKHFTYKCQELDDFYKTMPHGVLYHMLIMTSVFYPLFSITRPWSRSF